MLIPVDVSPLQEGGHHKPRRSYYEIAVKDPSHDLGAITFRNYYTAFVTVEQQQDGTLPLYTNHTIINDVMVVHSIASLHH